MTTLWVPLVDASAGCGGKAAHLAALLRAGLPVPDGFALPHAAFAAVVGDGGPVALDEIGAAIAAMQRAVESARPPDELLVAVDQHAAALGRLAVRSSISIEDQHGGGAPGVYASCVDVDPEDVWTAIRAVWASALSPLSIAYARHRGVAQVEVGVIVQRFVQGPRVTVYTRPPSRPTDDEAWLEPAQGALAKVPRSAPDSRLRLAIAAETAIGADGGADVELVVSARGPVVVQARPIRHAPTARAGDGAHAPRVSPPPALFAFTRRTPGLVWRWDAAHNPEPMSEAQAGLCELVDDPQRFPIDLPQAARGAVSPYRMRVVAGYLYWTSRTDTAPAAATLRVPTSTPRLAEQWAMLDARMVAPLEGVGPRPTLRAALDAYLAFYRVWAREVSPLLAAARAVLPGRIASVTGDQAGAERLAAELSGSRTMTVSARITAAAHGALDEAALLAAIGDMAPSWDVAAPTFAETPELVRAAIVRARRRPPATTPMLVSFRELDQVRTDLGPGADDTIELARLAGNLSELDDVRFARAQAMVRRALLDAAPAGIEPGDVFWLPLDEIAAGHTFEPEVAAARAAAARAAAARAARWAMPLSVIEGQTIPTAPAGDGLRGVGTGPRVVGRVAHVVGPGEVSRGAIAVVRAVTPALALALDDAAAIVAEHGGILDHGAALARELGIPCVTGCAGVWDALPEGALVAVDGAAGTIELA